MTSHDRRHEHAAALIEELRLFIAEHGLLVPQGVSPTILETLTEDLVRPPPPIYHEYLRVFGASFELMKHFGYSLSMDEADLFQDFDGRRYATIAIYRDGEMGDEHFIGYDFDSPTLGGLDCRLVQINVDGRVSETCHASLLELLRQCVLGHVRFGDDGYWGGADVGVECREFEVDKLWGAIFDFGANRGLRVIEPRSCSYTFLDGPDLWVEAGSCGEPSPVGIRVGGRLHHDVAIAREQLLDTIRARCPDCRVTEYK